MICIIPSRSRNCSTTERDNVSMVDDSARSLMAELTLVGQPFAVVDQNWLRGKSHKIALDN